MCSFIAKNPRRPLGALLVTFLLWAAAACSHTHTVSTAGRKVSYQEKGKDGGAVTVTGKDGQTATLNFNQNKVPDDYPRDLPIYTPSNITTAQLTMQILTDKQ